MLVVTVEIWPKGSREHRKRIGRYVVANDLSGTPETGNYDVYVGDPESEPIQDWGKVERVEGHERTLGHEALLARVFDHLAIRSVRRRRRR